ncbi:MAG: adenylosuccinate synthase [Bacteroidetes bacterium]|nr:adenylosuccinate synthase [Bacteroidota bacterium]MBK9412691.1 adenylosuccinate synthase [Bacteroidota bacterium]
MSVDVLLGLQWGDEGKGKIVDVLTPEYNVVARFQGGPNAGHTLEFEGIKHVLHTIPSGIFRKGITNIVGNGVVIDPVTLKKEIDALKKMNVDINASLFISRKAHIIIPTHRLLDAASESHKGKEKIGSTLRGIGPTYMDKTGRNGLRVGDIESPDFKNRYEKLKNKHLQILDQMNHDKDLSELEGPFFEGIELMRTLNFVDSEHVINQSILQNKTILAEGAQGSLLDIDFGSYPFVTSSNTITAGACTGLGVAPKHIGKVFGIFKAYCTRVGSGPFPTELNDETGEALRKAGNEFGATTGRPRRCGWLDLPALKYAIMINGVTDLIMTKPDVLSGFPTLKVCTHYIVNGKKMDYMPFDIVNEPAEPVYIDLPGWQKDLTGIVNEKDFPDELSQYIVYLEKELNVPVSIVSVGPDRKQTIRRMDLVIS